MIQKHMSIHLAGLLENMAKKRSGSKSILEDKGRKLSIAEARDWTREKIAEGYVLFPCCGLEECIGFDKVKGCPGHEKPNTLNTPTP